MGERFVGRAHDLALLEDAARACAGGRGQLVLVGGEPGVGKTWLAEKLAARLISQGWRVAVARCAEGGGAPAFWPWIQVLRGLIRAGVLTAGDLDVEVARVVPELGVVAPRVVDQVVGGERFALFDALTRLLLDIAVERPLLVVLDDLHSGDEPSLSLLRFIANELSTMRVLVLGTFRDTEPTGTRLMVLMSELTSDHQVLSLGGLSRSDVAELVAGSEGVDLATVYRWTNGNPLFVREVVRLLAVSDVPAGVPAGVRAVIERRVGMLSVQCRSLLSTASVLGVEFRLDVLAQVADVDLAQSMKWLDEAIGARLVDPRSESLVFGFSHALVREGLYDGLNRTERAEVHRRVAMTLEDRFAGDLRPCLAELAHHYAEGGSAARAVEVSARAGLLSLQLLAYEDAADHFQRALRLVDPVDSRQRCELMLQLGRAQMAAGSLASARDTYAQAGALAEQLGAGELLARAALGLGLDFTAGVDDVEVRLLEQALRVINNEDSALRARLLARLAKALLFTPNADRRMALGNEAVALARRIAEPATLGWVLVDHMIAVWAMADTAQRLTDTSEVVRLAQQAGDRVLAIHGRALRLGALLEVGDVAAWTSEISEFDRATRELHQPQYRWYLPLLESTRATLHGNFSAAIRLAHTGLAEGQRTGHPGAEYFFLTALCCAHVAQGRVADNEPLLRTAVERGAVIPTVIAGWSYSLCVIDRREQARAGFEQLVADNLAALPRDFTWPSTLCTLSLTCWALGDRERAVALYDKLLPFAPSLSRVSRLGHGFLGPTAFYLGLLAETIGEFDLAIKHLQHAIDTCHRIGARPFEAHSRDALARALAARTQPADSDRARTERTNAQSIAIELGMQLLTSTPTTSPAPTPTRRTFRREGEYWTISFSGAKFRLRHTVGLSYLAQLLASPGAEHHALDLAGHSGPASDAGAILDAQAKTAYRRRLEDLADNLAEAENFGDSERAARARVEIDALTEELARAVGLGGRDRRAASDTERARVRVTKAIKAAIDRVTDHDPALGQHLRHTVHTGVFCSYIPDAATRTTWTT